MNDNIPQPKKQKKEEKNEEKKINVKEKYAKPTMVDFTFKKLFGTEGNQQLTIDFLNSLFDFSSDELIREVSFKDPYQKTILKGKMSILVVFCTDIKGRNFIIEIQQAKFPSFEKRIQYYTNNVYSNQLLTHTNLLILPVYTLIITEFYLFPDYVPYISHHEIRETKTQSNLLKETKYTFVELSKFKMDKVEKNSDQWLYFLKYYQQGPPKNSTNEILKAFRELELSNWTEEELKIYSKELLENNDIESRVEMAKEEGREEGREEIIIEMVNKSIPLEKISVITKKSLEELTVILLKNKFPIETVVTLTKLSNEKVLELKTKFELL